MKITTSRIQLKHKQYNIDEMKLEAKLTVQQVQTLAQLCLQIYNTNNQYNGGEKSE